MNEKVKAQLIVEAEKNFYENNYAIAKKVLAQIINEDPKNTKANELLGYICGNEGNRDEFFRLIQLACDDSGCSAMALYYFGSELLERCRYEDAINYLKKSTLIGGDSFESLHNIGLAYAYLRQT